MGKKEDKLKKSYFSETIDNISQKNKISSDTYREAVKEVKKLREKIRMEKDRRKRT